jgi:hypothetical protein
MNIKYFVFVSATSCFVFLMFFIQGCKNVSESKVLFSVSSGDKHRTVEVIQRENRFFVVENGKESEGYEDIGIDPPVFSPDGNHLAYVVGRGKKRAVILDKQESETYFDVDSKNVFISPNIKSEGVNTSLLKWLTENNGVYIGPRPKPVGKQLDGHIRGENGLVFSSDSKKLAYCIWINENETAVVVDGIVGPTFHILGASGIIFSPDSQKYSYIGEKLGKWHVVVNKNLSKGYDAIGSSGYKFNDDWTEVTFRAQEAGIWQTMTWVISK